MRFVEFRDEAERQSFVAGLPGLTEHLTALNRVATLDRNFTGMGIGGDVAIGVPHQDEVAIPLQLAAGIGHRAFFSRLHRRAFRHGDVDAFIAALAREAGDDAAARRPAACDEPTRSRREAAPAADRRGNWRSTSGVHIAGLRSGAKPSR